MKFKFTGRKIDVTDGLRDYTTNKLSKLNKFFGAEADADVTNGTIVKIFDIIRENGYSAVNLRTSDK